MWFSIFGNIGKFVNLDLLKSRMNNRSIEIETSEATTIELLN